MTRITEKPQGSFLARLVRKQIFIPLAALLILIVFNFIADPSFFAITLKENSLGDLVLTGNAKEAISVPNHLRGVQNR